MCVINAMRVTTRVVFWMGPLQGIRIIDMTSVLMGPYATQTLGDYGADVIKVEAPDGDITRQIGPARHPGMGPVYLNANRSKRSLSLDLKTAAGRAVLLRLAAGADVLVYNLRPQAMARLKLDYESVSAVNPRIVYAGMFGFGQDGPYAAKPAYDDLLQAGAGLSHLLARAGDGTPRYVPTALADRVVGLSAVGIILASLLHRDRSGRGQRVDIPMFETMVGFVMGDHLGGLTFEPPLDQGGYARHMSPDRRPYRTSDGFVSVIIYNDKQWNSFFDLTGREDLRRDAMFATFDGRMTNIDAVYAELGRIFAVRSTAEWMKLLHEADIPVMPVHDLQSLLKDPHLVETEFFPIAEHPTEGAIRSMRVAATWSETSADPSRLAPRLGEQSREILGEAGFTDEEITRLVQDGVVRTASPLPPPRD
jgi:crotonobetainyl-CoA:carnitine CoA-transferase CaiB-like acyl-CoA transferase